MCLHGDQMDTTVPYMDTSTYRSAVAKTVTESLKAGGYSEKAMAEATGIPRVTLRRRLSGTSPFNVSELDAIARTLGIPIRNLTDPATSDGDAA